MVFSGGELQLHLIKVDGELPELNKAVHFAMRTSDFDAFLIHLRSKGVDYFNWAGESGMVNHRADGVRQIYIRDPDGYWIEVNNRKTLVEIEKLK